MGEKMKETETLKQQIHEVMSQNANAIPSKAAPLIEETLTKMLSENLSLKEALGFTDEMIEEIYEHGYHLFQSGKYKDALTVFDLLRQIDGLDPRLTFAIAACNHQAKNYIEAAGNYMLYEALDQTNPLPYYHLYDCFLKMGHPALAFDALKLAHRLAGDNPRYTELKGKIEIELQHLKDLEGGSEKKQESTAA